MCEDKRYNQKSDVWALGIILYEMATLNYPFQAKNEAGLMLKIVRGKYSTSKIQSLYTNGKDSATLIQSMLIKDMNERPSVK